MSENNEINQGSAGLGTLNTILKLLGHVPEVSAGISGKAFAGGVDDIG